MAAITPIGLLDQQRQHQHQQPPKSPVKPLKQLHTKDAGNEAYWLPLIYTKVYTEKDTKKFQPRILRDRLKLENLSHQVIFLWAIIFFGLFLSLAIYLIHSNLTQEEEGTGGGELPCQSIPKSSSSSSSSSIAEKKKYPCQQEQDHSKQVMSRLLVLVGLLFLLMVIGSKMVAFARAKCKRKEGVVILPTIQKLTYPAMEIDTIITKPKENKTTMVEIDSIQIVLPSQKPKKNKKQQKVQIVPLSSICLPQK